MSDAGEAALRERQQGGRKTGTVGLRDFDRGVVETLGAVVVKDNYFLTIPGVSPAPGHPGIQVVFAFPEDIYEHWKKPSIVVSRDDVSTAMQRYHPGAYQYRAPAAGARPVVVSGIQGFTSMETMSQAVPFDLSYSLNIITTGRGSGGSRAQAGLMLDWVLRKFPPYCAIYVLDSIGDQRTYTAWMDGVGMLDEVAEVSERTIGFAVTLRVEAEFDLAEPEIHSTVTAPPTFKFKRKP
jgi:hypothetical protein